MFSFRVQSVRLHHVRTSHPMPHRMPLLDKRVLIEVSGRNTEMSSDAECRPIQTPVMDWPVILFNDMPTGIWRERNAPALRCPIINGMPPQACLPMIKQATGGI